MTCSFHTNKQRPSLQEFQRQSAQGTILQSHHRTTAPPGFENNHDALKQLIRFGFGIWTAPQMQVLLFHAERSVSYGKESDQHSQAQAVNGIFSRNAGFWVRGPAGISKATWHRVNSALESDPEVSTAPQESDAPRVLTRTRRKHASGADAATEYAIDWLKVAEAIAKFRHTVPEMLPLLAGIPAAVEEEGVSHRDTGCLSLRQGGVSPRDTPPHLRVSHRETPTPVTPEIYTAGSAQRRRADLLASEVAAVKEWITTAWGAPIPRRWTYIPGQVNEIAAKLGIHGPAIEKWIRELMQAKNRQHYRVENPGFFATAAAIDLIQWARQPDNRNICAAAARDHALTIQQLASPPPGELLNMHPAEPAPLSLPDLPAMALKMKFGGSN